MAAARWTIEGHVFQNKTDYDAAIRDQAKINKIRKDSNFKNYNDVMKLFSLVQSGDYEFESVLGRDFDDEIFELVEKLKNNQSSNKAKFNKESSKNIAKNFRKKVNKKGNGKNDKVVVKLEDYEEEFRKEIIIQLKLREKRHKLLIMCFSLIATLCIGYFVFYSYMADKTQKEFEQLASLKEVSNTGDSEKKKNITGTTSQEEIIVPDILEQYKTLFNKNKKLIGWIKIDDTNIDYPVMQSSNSEYYLDHNFNQEYDKNGSIFLDPQCSVLDRSDNLIIYGHHMQSGKMFGSLEKYSDVDYYEKHPTISFDTIYEEGNYQIMYVFRSRIYNENEVVFKYYQFFNAISEAEFNSNMEEMAAISLYDTGVTARYGDKLLTLSTCDYQETNGRFVVIAKKIQ